MLAQIDLSVHITIILKSWLTSFLFCSIRSKSDTKLKKQNVPLITLCTCKLQLHYKIKVTLLSDWYFFIITAILLFRSRFCFSTSFRLYKNEEKTSKKTDKNKWSIYQVIANVIHPIFTFALFWCSFFIRKTLHWNITTQYICLHFFVRWCVGKQNQGWSKIKLQLFTNHLTSYTASQILHNVKKNNFPKCLILIIEGNQHIATSNVLTHGSI